MKRGALLLVLDIDVDATLRKVVNTECLVFLSCNMHHTGPKFVTDIEVGASFLHKQR